jgi:phasin family protein
MGVANKEATAASATDHWYRWFHDPDQRPRSEPEKQKATPAKEDDLKHPRNRSPREKDAIEQTAQEALNSQAEASEQATRLAQDTTDQISRLTRLGAEHANQLRLATAEIGERVAQVGAEIVAHNTETLQRTWQSGLSLANQLSQQSFEQFTRLLGNASERATQASRRSSRHVEAMMQTSTALTSGIEALSQGLAETAQRGLRQQHEHVEQAWLARTPHDLAALQAEIMRTSMESMLQGFRTIAEVSARLAEDAANRISEE